MFTSYFAKSKKILDSGRTPISISRFKPKWFNGPEFKQLAPTIDILNNYKSGLIDDYDYIELYHNDVLNKLNPTEVYNYLVSTYGDDVVLCCYEKIGDFCHRHMVALWFEKHLNVTIPELKI